MRVEILLSAAAVVVPEDAPPVPGAPPPPAPKITEPPPSPAAPIAHPVAPPLFDWRSLIDADLWDQVPADVADLIRFLAVSDLYVQDEIKIDLHPTLSRTWSRKGRRGQRRVRAPGQNDTLVGFGTADWRTGWLSHGFSRHRDAETVCQQIDHLVARSLQRGRKVILLWDNLRIHTRKGSKKLRACLERHGENLRLVSTPAYDPEANPTERLWRPFLQKVTHNHRRTSLYDLQMDAHRHFHALDQAPDRVLSHLGSPFAPLTPLPDACR